MLSLQLDKALQAGLLNTVQFPSTVTLLFVLNFQIVTNYNNVTLFNCVDIINP